MDLDLSSRVSGGLYTYDSWQSGEIRPVSRPANSLCETLTSKSRAHVLYRLGHDRGMVCPHSWQYATPAAVVHEALGA